jgi:hypothetical protein
MVSRTSGATPGSPLSSLSTAPGTGGNGQPHGVGSTVAMADQRSTWGTIATVAAAISAIALVALIADAIGGLEDFEQDEDSASGAVLWGVFSAGALIALIAGVLAFVRGLSGHIADRGAGRIGMAWFAIAALALALWGLLA